METFAALYSVDVSTCALWPWRAPEGGFISMFPEPLDQLEPLKRLPAE